MPTPRVFNQYPKFPSDVPLAPTPVISLTQLQQSSAQESRALYQACREHGYFLLDMRGNTEGERLLGYAENMFELSAETLDLPAEVLDEYVCKPPKDLQGYKRAGTLKVSEDKVDTMELYTLNQDDVMETVAPRPHPEPLMARQKDCRDFFVSAHKTVSVVLNMLDKHLGLPEGTLASYGPLDQPSATSLRMLLSRPGHKVDQKRIAFGGHTDIGTITMLFNVVGGLQMLPDGCDNVDENWRYVRPHPGCCLIQIGDTMVEWTGGLLRSALHRVVDPPGEQAVVGRPSLAYLVRPARAATMGRLKNSPVVPPLVQGEMEELRSVDDWATWRARQVMMGELNPQSKGGLSVRPAQVIAV